MKDFIKRCQKLLLLFLLSVVPTMPISAKEEDSSKDNQPKSEEYYINLKRMSSVYKNFNSYTAVNSSRDNPTFVSGPGNLTVYKFLVGSEELFCIEPAMMARANVPYTKKLSGSEVTAALMKKEPTLGYTQAQIQEMAQAASVGYGYKGDVSNDMYSATQIRIWQCVYPNGFSSIPESVQLKLDEINKRMNVFKQKPSFAGQNLEFQGLGQKNAIEIQDTNSVFEMYDLQNKEKGVHVEKDGNRAKIWIDENAPVSGSLSFQALYDNSQATSQKIAYYSATTQIIGNFGKVPAPNITLTYSLKNNSKYGDVSSQKQSKENRNVKLQLNKKDSDSKTPIQGAEFEFFENDKSVGTSITNEEGIASLLIDDNQNIESESFTEQYVENYTELPPYYQQEALNKGYFKSKEEAQKAADKKAQDSLEEKIKEFKEKKYTYTAKEINAAPGYYLDPNNSEYTKEFAGSGEVIFEASNKSIKGEIKISKTGPMLEDYVFDEEGKFTDFIYKEKGLKDVSYNLYAAKDIIDGNGEVLCKKDEIFDNTLTDDKGEASFKNLPLGSYYVKEEKAPEGFVLDEKSYPVELNAEDSSKEIISENLELKNEKQKLNIQALKTASYNKPMKEIRFGLYIDQDLKVKDKILKKGTLIEETLSDEKGNVSFKSDLPLALYSILELETPKGFEKNDKTYEVNGLYTNQNQSENTIQIPIINQFKPVTLKIAKKDKDSLNVIKNNTAEFTVEFLDIENEEEKTEDKIWIENTDDQGICTITFNQPGKYSIKENKAPNGYLLSDEVIQVEVKEDGTLLIDEKEVNNEETVDFVNEAIPEEEYPFQNVITSAALHKNLYLLLAGVSILGIGFVFYKKKH